MLKILMHAIFLNPLKITCKRYYIYKDNAHSAEDGQEQAILLIFTKAHPEMYKKIKVW